jgi:phosphotriesterase-related protein
LQVQSVLGEVKAEALGMTLVHEHVVSGLSGVFLDWRYAVDRQQVIIRACEALKRAGQHGLKTFVDATTIEMGRDPELLAEVSSRSDTTIICSSGLYASQYGLPTHFREMTVNELADLYIEELMTGIAGTGIRSGVIKVATSDEEPSGSEMKVLQAAAIAQQRAGVPIITHTTGRGGDRQAALLIEQGVAADSLVIGHVDHKNSSPRYLARILRSGASIAFDRVGNESFLSDSIRAGLFAGLIGDGYLDQLFLSMDSSISWVGPIYPAARSASEPCVHLFAKFMPMLRRMGVADEAIERVLVENPLRLFLNAQR